MDSGAACPSIRLQAPAGIELPAGDGRGPRFDSFGFSPPPLGRRRPPAQARSGEPRDAPRRPPPENRPNGVAGRAVRRDATRRGDGPLLLAGHAVADAVLQLLSSLRGQSLRRPRVRPDRRRALLDVQHRLSPGAGAHRRRARSRPYRARHSCTADRGLLHPGREQAQRLSDRPRGAESQEDFFRRARRRRPGCRHTGKHGNDPGPHPGASRLLGQRHRQDAPPAHGRGKRGGARERAAGPRSRRAGRSRGGYSGAARDEPARCGCDSAEGTGENGAYGMKKRALHVLLAVASLAVVPRVAAQDSRGVLAGLAAYEGADRPQRLLEGARREGFLSLYTSFPPEDVATLNAAFEKKYGVKVRAWRAASEKVLQRTVAEAQAGRDEVDLVDSNSVPLEL